MRTYPVPLQIENEERLIGGFLSLRQLIYLILGAVLGSGAAFGALFLPVSLRFVLFCVFAGAGAVMALVLVQDESMDVYLWRWLVWMADQREFYWEGDEE